MNSPDEYTRGVQGGGRVEERGHETTMVSRRRLQLRNDVVEAFNEPV